VILFAFIFIETGVVVFPFLPGDSLIFAAGLFAADRQLSFWGLLVVFIVAAFLGNVSNYWIARIVGPRLFKTNSAAIFKKKYVIEAQEFYAIHGDATLVLGRFIPIIRTFVPFVAGLGKMNYRKFIIYSIVGCVAWVCLFLISGYFFGSIQWVQVNLSLIVILIVVVSFIPVIYSGIKRLSKRNKETVAKSTSSETTENVVAASSLNGESETAIEAPASEEPADEPSVAEPEDIGVPDDAVSN
jgi:membrane-associated protein